MYLNKKFKSIIMDEEYEDIKDYLFRAIYDDRTVYVIDKEGHYKGCIGRTELKQCEIENRVIINNRSKNSSF